MPEETEIILKRDKECKGSVRFITDNPDADVTNVYVMRKMAGIDKAKTIRIVVSVAA